MHIIRLSEEDLKALSTMGGPDGPSKSSSSAQRWSDARQFYWSAFEMVSERECEAGRYKCPEFVCHYDPVVTVGVLTEPAFV